MKISKQLFITLAICLTCMGLSCRKQKDELPKATQEGKNTFGCKINGEIFIPKDAITVPVLEGLTTYYDKDKKWLHISATEPKNEEGFQRNMSIDIKSVSLGNNLLSNINKAEIVLRKNNQQDQYFETNATVGGTLTITRLDTVAHIISGTFSFQAAPKFNPGPNISVTDGRFDITYKP